MAGRQAKVPSHRLHRATGCGVVTLRTGGVAKDYYTGRWGSSEADAKYRALIAEFLLNNRNLPAAAATGGTEDPGLSLAELCAMFLDKKRTQHKNGKLSASRLRTIERVIGGLRDSDHGMLPAAKFAPRHYFEIRDRLEDANQKVGTINLHTATIQSMFGWAREREITPYETSGRICDIPQLKDSRERKLEAVPDEHFNAILPFLRPTMKAVVIVMRRTGMRAGEACQLTLDTIDRTGDVWTFRPPQSKTGSFAERVIGIGPEAQEAMRPFIDETKPSRFLFRSKQGKTRGRQLIPGDITSAIVKACRKAKVPRFRGHQLRHTRLEEVRRLHGIDAAQVVGGHLNVKTTEIYAPPDREKAVKAARESG